MKKYKNIETVDRDCIVVIKKDSTGVGSKIPERFWGYNIVLKSEYDEKYKKDWFRSTYKPSTLPYYTSEQIIRDINEKL